MKENDGSGIVLLDIDKTIFDPKKFLDNLDQKLEELNLTKRGLAMSVYTEYINDLKSSSKKSTDFNPDDFIRRISEISNEPMDKLYEVFNSPDIWKTALYPEVELILNKLKDLNKNMGSFTEGFVHYQFKKLIMTGIDNFFDKKFLFISRRKLEDDLVEKLPNGAIIVDDNKEVIEELNTKGRFNLFWINRDEKNSEQIEGVTKIRSLSELIDLIKPREMAEAV